jgi:cytochrome b subunit of formate dehydrogenase
MTTRGSFVRFSNRQRLEHIVMMCAFVVLTATGLPQKYPDAGWAGWIVSHLGGIDTTRAIHRAFGLVLALVALEHLTVILGGLILGRARATMLLTRKDFRDAVQNLKYCLGLRPKPPQFDRFDYKQKWEYWGLLFGGIVMCLTGFVLWFPTFATRVLPGVVIPTAKVLHTNEAMLALLGLAKFCRASEAPARPARRARLRAIVDTIEDAAHRRLIEERIERLLWPAPPAPDAGRFRFAFAVIGLGAVLCVIA